jgi:hypothetical protein
VSINGVGTRPAARAIASLKFCGIAARRMCILSLSASCRVTGAS